MKVKAGISVRHLTAQLRPKTPLTALDSGRQADRKKIKRWRMSESDYILWNVFLSQVRSQSGVCERTQQGQRRRKWLAEVSWRKLALVARPVCGVVLPAAHQLWCHDPVLTVGKTQAFFLLCYTSLHGAYSYFTKKDSTLWVNVSSVRNRTNDVIVMSSELHGLSLLETPEKVLWAKSQRRRCGPGKMRAFHQPGCNKTYFYVQAAHRLNRKNN